MKKQWEINVDFKLSVIPVSSQKEPFGKWKQYQQIQAPIEIWLSHFQKEGTVGIITGRISGNMEVIDVDVKNDPQKTIMEEYKSLIPPDLYQKLIIQTTPNHGYHLIYSCPDEIIDKNDKLACHADGAVIIETRGEGGYFCTSKVNNRILQGKLDLESLEVEIPIITPEERDFLLETARSLTRYFPKSTASDQPYLYKESAINDFNNKYPIVDLFAKHGWTIEDEDHEKSLLKRPGSSAHHSGYYFKETHTFFCFSTSTGFKPEKPYNHFQILQVLEGDHDYNKTVRLLADYGFPVTKESSKITSDDIANFLNHRGVRNDTFIQDLTMEDQVIDELDYNTLYIDLKNHFNREIPRSRFEEIIKSRYIQPFNPIEEFIKKYHYRRSIGVFDEWLDCLELKNPMIDKQVVKFFLIKWYVGMIAQALGGTYPNEFFLALLSVEQGIGKSSFLRNHTLPQELHKYQVEHPLTVDEDFKVLMGQTLLIIDDEIDGRSYESLATFKNLMSNPGWKIRKKYDRRHSYIKRRCSFAGSGNNLNVVRESGNRRIIPIEIKRMDFEKLEQIDLVDLFMEAYHLFTNGFHYSYQSSDQKVLQQLYQDYVQKSDVELVLDEMIELPESENDIFFLSSLDLVTTLYAHYPQFEKRLNGVAIGKLMNDKGFESERRGKTKKTLYLISNQSRIVSLIQWDQSVEKTI